MSKRSLQEPTFLILTALAAGAQHGYGIMTDVGQISDGRGKLRAGTLYAALDRLAADHLIEVDREEIVDGRLRRYYRLTPPGAQRLAAEVERMRTHTAGAARRLDLLGGPARTRHWRPATGGWRPRSNGGARTLRSRPGGSICSEAWREHDAGGPLPPAAGHVSGRAPVQAPGRDARRADDRGERRAAPAGAGRHRQPDLGCVADQAPPGQPRHRVAALA